MKIGLDSTATNTGTIDTRLGTPNHPGDVVTLTGELAVVDATSGRVTIDIRATNTLGVHAQGVIDVEVPTA